MEKKIENLKKEILRVMNCNVLIGELDFFCHNVEITKCNEIVNWCEEKGLKTNIEIKTCEGSSSDYVAIAITNKDYKNRSAVLFSTSFHQEPGMHDVWIDILNKKIKLLKKSKKEVIHQISILENNAVKSQIDKTN